MKGLFFLDILCRNPLVSCPCDTLRSAQRKPLRGPRGARGKSQESARTPQAPAAPAPSRRLPRRRRPRRCARSGGPLLGARRAIGGMAVKNTPVRSHMGRAQACGRRDGQLGGSQGGLWYQFSFVSYGRPFRGWPGICSEIARSGTPDVVQIHIWGAYFRSGVPSRAWFRSPSAGSVLAVSSMAGLQCAMPPSLSDRCKALGVMAPVAPIFFRIRAPWG